MTAWCDGENTVMVQDGSTTSLRLMDGPETIAGWLNGIDVVTGTTVVELNKTATNGTCTTKRGIAGKPPAWWSPPRCLNSTE